MKSLLLVLLIGGTAAVLYDTAGSVISIATRFDYGWFALGSLVLYGTFGFLAGRRSGWAYGMVAGALMGLVDSTIGWAISWTIGPGRPDTEMKAPMVIATIVFVTILGAVVGTVGGLLSRFTKRHA